MTNETDDNQRWEYIENVAPIYWHIIDDSPSRVFLEITRNSEAHTYRLADDLTMEEARHVIAVVNGFLPASAVIEEAEILIDNLLKERYPGIKEIV